MDTSKSEVILKPISGYSVVVIMIGLFALLIFLSVTTAPVVGLFIAIVAVIAYLGKGLIVINPNSAALMLLELFVAFLQAYIFAFLTSLFIGMAVQEHDHDDHHAIEDYEVPRHVADPEPDNRQGNERNRRDRSHQLKQGLSELSDDLDSPNQCTGQNAENAADHITHKHTFKTYADMDK